MKILHFAAILSLLLTAADAKRVEFENSPTNSSSIHDNDTKQNKNMEILLKKMSNPKRLPDFERIANNFINDLNNSPEISNNTNNRTIPSGPQINKKQTANKKLTKFKKNSNKTKDSDKFKPFKNLKLRNSYIELSQLMNTIKKEMKKRKREIKKITKQKQRETVKGRLSSKDFSPNNQHLLNEREIRRIVHEQVKKSFLRILLQYKLKNI